MKAFGAHYADQRIVAPGTPEVFEVPGVTGVCVIVDAGVGNQASVEYTSSPHAAIADDSALWSAWDAGTVSAVTRDGLSYPVTGVRVTATLGAVTAAVCC